MKFFKKVLFHLYPRILFVEIACCILLLYIAVHALSVQSFLYDFYWKWKLIIIVFVAVLGTIVFIPKVLKIIFHKPPRGQKSTRWALLLIIFMSIAAPNIIMLDHVAVAYFGKTKTIHSIDEMKYHPDYTFFMMNDTDSFSPHVNGYYIHQHVSGRHEKTFHIDIFASKSFIIQDTIIIVGKQYHTEYDGRPSNDYAKRLVDNAFTTAQTDFETLQIKENDVMMRVFEKNVRQKYLEGVESARSYQPSKIFLFQLNSFHIAHARKKSMYIYLGFFIFVNGVIVLTLLSGKYIKE